MAGLEGPFQIPFHDPVLDLVLTGPSGGCFKGPENAFSKASWNSGLEW